jgi:hypothetical protein
MHDLDRQQLEQYEQEGLFGESAIGELTEAHEMELASQFLEIASEEELEAFLGDLFNRVKKTSTFNAARDAYNSTLAQKRVIPMVMRAAPLAADFASKLLLPSGVDADVFGMTQHALQSTKAKLDGVFKKELEGLSGEDREFEAARSYIRFAIEALQRALQTPPRVPQPVAAQIAVRESARRHAPGLVALMPALTGAAPQPPGTNGGESSGRWVRRGSSVVIDLG